MIVVSILRVKSRIEPVRDPLPHVPRRVVKSVAVRWSNRRDRCRNTRQPQCSSPGRCPARHSSDAHLTARDRRPRERPCPRGLPWQRISTRLRSGGACRAKRSRPAHRSTRHARSDGRCVRRPMTEDLQDVANQHPRPCATMGPGPPIASAGNRQGAALRRQTTSRTAPPRSHTHVVAANLARGSDGRWSALHGYPLFQHAKAAGVAVSGAPARGGARAAFVGAVGRCAQRDGRARGRAARGAGDFSRRRAEILEWLEAEERSGRQSAEKAALATREPKADPVALAPWSERVRAEAAEHGLGRAELAELTGLAVLEPTRSVDLERAGATLAGPQGLTARRNSFGGVTRSASWRRPIARARASNRWSALRTRFLAARRRRADPRRVGPAAVHDREPVGVRTEDRRRGRARPKLGRRRGRRGGRSSSRCANCEWH